MTSGLLFSARQSPSDKVPTLKGKKLLPFFIFRVDPFFERNQYNFDSAFSITPYHRYSKI